MLKAGLLPQRSRAYGVCRRCLNVNRWFVIVYFEPTSEWICQCGLPFCSWYISAYHVQVVPWWWPGGIFGQDCVRRLWQRRRIELLSYPGQSAACDNIWPYRSRRVHTEQVLWGISLIDVKRIIYYANLTSCPECVTQSYGLVGNC